MHAHLHLDHSRHQVCKSVSLALYLPACTLASLLVLVELGAVAPDGELWLAPYRGAESLCRYALTDRFQMLEVAGKLGCEVCAEYRLMIVGGMSMNLAAVETLVRLEVVEIMVKLVAAEMMANVEVAETLVSVEVRRIVVMDRSAVRLLEQTERLPVTVYRIVMVGPKNLGMEVVLSISVVEPGCRSLGSGVDTRLVGAGTVPLDLDTARGIL